MKKTSPRFIELSEDIISLIGDSEVDPGREKLTKEFLSWEAGIYRATIKTLLAARDNDPALGF
jgi:hypothetical protein